MASPKATAVHFLNTGSAVIVRETGYPGSVVLPCGRQNSERLQTFTPAEHIYSYALGRMLRKQERIYQALQHVTCKLCRKALAAKN